MKNILTYKLFEQVYLNDLNPFDRASKYPKGLRFVNKDEALKSVRRLQEMLNKNEIEVKDAIIASLVVMQDLIIQLDLKTFSLAMVPVVVSLLGVVIQ